MASHYDFKKEWPHLKKELTRMSTEAIKMVKKGEDEIVRYSHIGKMHLDITALKLKKEHLYHLVGKEYVQAATPKAPTAKLQKYLAEIQKIEKDIKDLVCKTEVKTPKKKTPTRKKVTLKGPIQPEILPKEEQLSDN
jgi:hypothetical protein